MKDNTIVVAEVKTDRSKHGCLTDSEEIMYTYDSKFVRALHLAYLAFKEIMRLNRSSANIEMVLYCNGGEK